MNKMTHAKRPKLDPSTPPAAIYLIQYAGLNSSDEHPLAPRPFPNRRLCRCGDVSCSTPGRPDRASAAGRCSRRECPIPSSIASSRASGSSRQNAKQRFCSIPGSMATKLDCHVVLFFSSLNAIIGRSPEVETAHDRGGRVGGNTNRPATCVA
jgi:hypothetical protein